MAYRWSIRIAMACILLSGGVARAGPPFINLEGVGGVAFNPLAYPAVNAEKGIDVGGVEVAKPRLGIWHVNLNESSIDWTTIGGATSIARRLEVSFGYEAVAIVGAGTAHKKNVAGKLLLVEENAFGTSFLPALSAGVLWKSTTLHPGADPSGVDFYAVATKMITQLPVPVLLSAGGLSTKGQVDGVIGFNSQRALVVFGNVDVIPLSWLAVGAEYRMGPNYGAAGGNYVDGDYYQFHAAFLATSSFTIIGSYAHAAVKTDGARPMSTANPVGFGPGVVVSGQYAF